MDKIEQCVSDVVAIANGARDHKTSEGCAGDPAVRLTDVRRQLKHTTREVGTRGADRGASARRAEP
jgi:hypothetical protein